MAIRTARARHGMRPILAGLRIAVPLAAGLLCASCSTLSNVSNNVFGSSAPPAGQPGHVAGFLGGVVADEPRAVLAGRQVLSRGWQCRRRRGGGRLRAGGDAAVARGTRRRRRLSGLFAGEGHDQSRGSRGDHVHAGRAGQSGTERRSARRGADAGARPVSAACPLRPRAVREPDRAGRALCALGRADLARARGGPCGGGRTAVGRPGGACRVRPRTACRCRKGETLLQPALGATLAQLRMAGVGDLYQGALARQLASASTAVGGPLTLDELRRALPSLGTPLVGAGQRRQRGVPAAAGRWRAGGGRGVHLPAAARRTTSAARARGPWRWRRAGAPAG